MYIEMNTNGCIVSCSFRAKGDHNPTQTIGVKIMKTLTLQQEFNVILANQSWYGLTMPEKLNLLCNAGSEYKEVAQASLVAVIRHRKTHKQKAAVGIKTNRVKAVKTKVARATTIIFPAAMAGQAVALATSLLRSMGRKICVATAIGEALCLSVETLAFASKEEAVNSAWSAFKAVVMTAK